MCLCLSVSAFISPHSLSISVYVLHIFLYMDILFCFIYTCSTYIYIRGYYRLFHFLKDDILRYRMYIVHLCYSDIGAEVEVKKKNGKRSIMAWQLELRRTEPVSNQHTF